MSPLLVPFVAIAGTLLAVSALLTVIRVAKGPTILDRMIASDVLFTILLLGLGVVMVTDTGMRTLPIMLAIAATAFISTVAVARYVSKQDRDPEKPGREERR